MQGKYFKDFDKWNTYSKILNNKKFAGFCNEREIWWCALGVNIGSEQDGKNNFFERPVLILKDFKNGTILIAPLTSRAWEGSYHFALEHEGKPTYLILNQLRTISIKRLLRFMRKLSTYEFALIEGRILDLFKE